MLRKQINNFSSPPEGGFPQRQETLSIPNRPKVSLTVAAQWGAIWATGIFLTMRGFYALQGNRPAITDKPERTPDSQTLQRRVVMENPIFNEENQITQLFNLSRQSLPAVGIDPGAFIGSSHTTPILLLDQNTQNFINIRTLFSQLPPEYQKTAINYLEQKINQEQTPSTQQQPSPNQANAVPQASPETTDQHIPRLTAIFQLFAGFSEEQRENVLRGFRTFQSPVIPLEKKNTEKPASSEPAVHKDEMGPYFSGSPIPATVSSPAAISKVSSKTKQFVGFIQWGNYRYKVEQELPKKTTPDAWNNIITSYREMLDDQTEIKSGTDSLTLSFDSDKDSVTISDNTRDPATNSAPKSVVIKANPTTRALFEYSRTLNLTKLTTQLLSPSVAGGGAAASATLLPPRGLPNTGNTCFIASVVQGWLIHQEEPLRRKHDADGTSDNDKQTISNILEWIKKYKQGQSIDLDLFRNLILTQKRDWYVNDTRLQQQDAADFMDLLKEFMLFEETEHTQQTIMNQPGFIFHQDPVTFSGTISLKLPRNENQEIDLNRAFGEYFKSPGAGRTIEQAEVDYPVDKEIKTLSSAPSELSIIVPRAISGEGSSKFAGSLSGDVETLHAPADYFEDGKEATYELQSVIEHRGRDGNGHYVAYVRRRDQFFLANDSSITPISQGVMLQATREKGSILIYRKASPTAQE